MSGILAYMAAMAIGVGLGYEPSPDGDMGYIVQIQPGTLELLKPGEELRCLILPEARDIHASRIRVIFGSGPLPKVLPPAAHPARPPVASPDQSLPGFMRPGNARLPPLTPETLPANKDARPMGEQPVGYVEPMAGTTRSDAVRGGTQSPGPAEAYRPWWLWLVVLALGASNVYLGWMWWDARRRYHGMLGRALSPQT